MARGDLDRAQSLLAQSWAAAVKGVTPEFVAHVSAALGELYLWLGRHEEAREAILNGHRLIAGRDDPLNMPVLYAMSVRVEAERAVRAQVIGRHRDARRAHGQAEEFAAGLRSMLDPARKWARPSTALSYLEQAEAELAGLRTEPCAAPMWERVACAWEDLDHPYLGARS